MAIPVAAMLAACGGGGDGIINTPERTASLTAIQLSPPTVTLTTGQTSQLQATLSGPGASTGQATTTFTTSAASVATVSAGGLVTAVGPGTATITATATHPQTSALNSSTVGASSQVTVSAAPNALTDLTVAPNPATVAVGATAQLVVTPVTAAGASATCAFVSSNLAVVTSSSSGLLTGVGAGTAVITVTCQGSGGNTTANSLVRTATVIVSPPPVATVRITAPTTYLQPGPGVGRTSTTLAVELKSAQGTVLTNRTVTFSSSAGAVATVSSGGLVSAVTTGSTLITATSEGVTDTVTINVVRAFGVVVANQPTTATYTAGVNSAGQANTIIRTAVGRYTVAFPDVGGNTIGRSFMFLVNAASGGPNSTITAVSANCYLLDAAVTTPVTLSVRCEDAVTGADKDAAFRAVLIGDNSLSGTFGFTLHQRLNTAPYQPLSAFSFNTFGASMQITPNFPNGANPVLTRHDQGITVASQMAFAQVVTSAPGQICNVFFQGANTSVVDVYCFDSFQPIATRFADLNHQVLRLSAGRAGQIYGAEIWNPQTGAKFSGGYASSGSSTVTRTGVGRYTVAFPGLSAPNGDFAVVAQPWSTNDYRSCTHHVVSNSPITIDVACVNVVGAFTDDASAIQVLVLR